MLTMLAGMAAKAIGGGAKAVIKGVGAAPMLAAVGLGGRRGRRRRRQALTQDDIKLMLMISSSISRKAAENFVLRRVRGG